MALQPLIEYMNSCGLPVTVTEGGKWHHSEDYLRLRVHGVRGLIQLLRQRAEAGDPKAPLQLQLVLNKSPEAVVSVSEAGIEEEV